MHTIRLLILAAGILICSCKQEPEHSVPFSTNSNASFRFRAPGDTVAKPKNEICGTAVNRMLLERLQEEEERARVAALKSKASNKKVASPADNF